MKNSIESLLYDLDISTFQYSKMCTDTDTVCMGEVVSGPQTKYADMRNWRDTLQLALEIIVNTEIVPLIHHIGTVLGLVGVWQKESLYTSIYLWGHFLAHGNAFLTELLVFLLKSFINIPDRRYGLSYVCLGVNHYIG